MYLFQDFKGKSKLNIIWGVFIVGNVYQAVFLYRLGSWFYKRKLRPLASIIASLNTKLHSCDISPAAEIGEGIVMHHSVGIVIGPGVKIGNKLNIFQNTTLGTRGDGKYPQLGDNVALFSGCAVVGGITVGNDVKIGANSVVIEDIPSYSTAVGAPARIIAKKPISSVKKMS
ncbi:serine acetyltransferase [Bacillus zanthoxyli]|nr:serine acetyltransferase [Bacillus zanthoxyli]